MPATSVIVPVYKAEQYIHQCIGSILAQTYTDFELILVDDGSPDNSGAICDAYTECDSRVRVIHQENQGQAAARNCAVKQAQGEWICFVDSDDMIHSQMLEILYNAVNKSEAKISMCSAINGGVPPQDFFQPISSCFSIYSVSEAYLTTLYDGSSLRPWSVCCKLIHKEIIVKHPFTNGRIFEDNAVVGRWLCEACVVADVDAALYFYRMTPTSTMRSAFNLKKIDYLWALEEMITFFDGVNYSRLCKRFCGTYLKSANEYYPLVCHEAKNKSAQRIIRRQMISVLWKKAKYFELTKTTIYHVGCILCPFMIRLYRFLRHLRKGAQS